jgi:hypothetical protein
MTRVMYAQYIYLIELGSIHYFYFGNETISYNSLTSKESRGDKIEKYFVTTCNFLMTQVMYAKYIYFIGLGSVHYFYFGNETR